MPRRKHVHQMVFNPAFNTIYTRTRVVDRVAHRTIVVGLENQNEQDRPTELVLTYRDAIALTARLAHQINYKLSEK